MSDRSADSIHHTDDDAALGNSIHDAAEPDTGASQAQDEEEQEMPLVSPTIPSSPAQCKKM